MVATYVPGPHGPMVFSVASAAPSGSGWGDHGTWIDLSTTTVSNDTMTSNNTSDFSAARGTQGYSTGKHYFEIKALTAPGANAVHVGLLDASVATGASMNSFTLANGGSTYFNNGNAQIDGTGITGVNIGAGITLANNDVVGVAFDADNGFHYLALNNAWFLSGDPTSGALGTGHVVAYTTVRTYYPRADLWGLVNGILQLKTVSFTYTPPTGYSAWGP